MTPRPKKFFFGTDPHVRMRDGKVCGVDLATNNAVVQFLEAEGPWDGYIGGGDTADFNVISSHNLGNLRAVQGESVLGEYRAVDAYLRQHYIAAGMPKFFKIIEGNHDYRIERYIDAHPELSGMLEMKRNLPDFVDWIPFWSEHQILTIGKASFIHGQHLAGNHPAAHLRDYGTNIFYGHTHDMVSSALRHHGSDNTKIAHSMGCLCDYNQEYMRGRPTKWQQGFGVFYFWPDGKFNFYPVMIFDHQFTAPSGKHYSGRKRPDTKLVLV